MARDRIPKRLEEALEMAARAFDAGDLEAARTAAARAVTLEPHSAEARHYLAAALCELGDHDGADRQYHEALALSPDDPEILIGACHLLLDHAKAPDAYEEVLELARRGAGIAARAEDVELEAEFLVAEGQALGGVGALKDALARFESAAARAPSYAEPHLQAGITRFELVQAEAARDALLRALSLEPELALAHWYLGLCAERLGDGEEAARRFKRARRIDPAGFPEPVQMTEAEFDAVVEEAIARIPERVRAEMQNLAIAVEPIPADDDLLGEDPPLPPTILGVFRGNPLGDKQSPDPWAHFPSSVVLYQRNLERACHSREELIEQIEITVLHEVGHFLGWDEDDLAARGLD